MPNETNPRAACEHLQKGRIEKQDLLLQKENLDCRDFFFFFGQQVKYVHA